MSSPDDRIRATYLIDILDAAIETLPPEARPGPYVDPATCAHPALFQFEHAPEPRRWYCDICGARAESTKDGA